MLQRYILEFYFNGNWSIAHITNNVINIIYALLLIFINHIIKIYGETNSYLSKTKEVSLKIMAFLLLDSYFHFHTSR